MNEQREIEEATGAKAAARAAGLFQQAAEKAGELKSQAAGAAADLKDRFTDHAADATAAGMSGLNAMLDGFNVALPVLSEAGFVLEGAEIGLGIPPQIVAHFSSSSTISDDAFEALVERHQGQRLTVLLMRALRKAQALQSRFSLAGLQPTGFAVEVGLIPTVVAKFA